jgi:bla regulator protein blaR1
MNTHIALFVAVASASVVGLRAQQPLDRPRFEVASIKPNVSNDGRISVNRTGSRYTASGISLSLLIRNAYNVQEFQVLGLPAWSNNDRFDIVATMPPDSDAPPIAGAPSRQALMVQGLLEERFQLTVHKETRDMPVYALVMANADRRLGPSLRRSTVDCAALIAAARGGGSRPPAPPAGELPPCSSSVAPGTIVVRSQTMAEIATALSRLTNTGSSLGRLIVDRTGLEGYYDVDLHFTPDRMPNFGPAGPPPGLPAIDPDAASIYAAMREQLGLKLDSQRAPVDVIVVDRVEKPTAD